MKLSTITQHWVPTNTKINYICGNHVCNNHNNKPIHLLFIESAFKSNLIEEGHWDAITSFLQSKLSQAQAALAPDTTKDLDSLLQFLAPKEGGGAKKVNELIQSAKNSPNDILNDQNWWAELFDTFGTDPQTRQSVLNQFEIEPQAAKPQAAQPQAARPQAAQPPSDSDADDAAFYAHLETDPKVKQAFEKSQERQGKAKAAAANLRELARKQKELSSTHNTAESVDCFTDLARMILELPIIQANLKTIIEHMVRSSGGRNIIIEQTGLLDRTTHILVEAPTLRQAGNYLLNPGQATRRNQISNIASQNERIAKQVVQILTDAARKKFAQTLQANQLTPRVLAGNIERFNIFKQKLSAGGQLNANEQADYKAIGARLTQAFKAFKHNEKTPFTTKLTATQKQAPPAPPAAKAAPTVDTKPSAKLINYLEKNNLIEPKVVNALRKLQHRKPSKLFTQLLGSKISDETKKGILDNFSTNKILDKEIVVDLYKKYLKSKGWSGTIREEIAQDDYLDERFLDCF